MQKTLGPRFRGDDAGEDPLVGQALAVPFPDQRRGLRHDRAQLGIVDAAHEHAGDRHEEEHQKEQEQGRDQQRRLSLAKSLAPP